MQELLNRYNILQSKKEKCDNRDESKSDFYIIALMKLRLFFSVGILFLAPIFSIFLFKMEFNSMFLFFPTMIIFFLFEESIAIIKHQKQNSKNEEIINAIRVADTGFLITFLCFIFSFLIYFKISSIYGQYNADFAVVSIIFIMSAFSSYVFLSLMLDKKDNIKNNKDDDLKIKEQYDINSDIFDIEMAVLKDSKTAAYFFLNMNEKYSFKNTIYEKYFKNSAIEKANNIINKQKIENI